MNQEKIGKFVATCRKEQKLTQAQLAEKLNITDRAVSKWETGKSMPDSSIMMELSKILGITVNELLSGEKVALEQQIEKADENLLSLKKNNENALSTRKILAIVLSGCFAIGMLACTICNLAIEGTMTWALIPISALIFAWGILFPTVLLGKGGIRLSLIALTVEIIPFLFVLNYILHVKEIISVGVAPAIVGVGYLWLVQLIWSRLKKRKNFAIGVCILILVPAQLAINLIVTIAIAQNSLDVWDGVGDFIMVGIAVVFFVLDYCERKRK